LSLPAKNLGISLPVMIVALLAKAILTLLVFGVAFSETSGSPQSPALTAFM